eukprot:IDg14064t1
MNVTKYRAPYFEVARSGPATSEWTKSSIPTELLFEFLGMEVRGIFPITHPSHVDEGTREDDMSGNLMIILRDLFPVLPCGARDPFFRDIAECQQQIPLIWLPKREFRLRRDYLNEFKWR